jgi:hypothetical protein
LARGVGHDRSNLFDQGGLETSTVTPGTTAPVVSFTTPAMLPLVNVCADERDGTVETRTRP